MSDPVRKAQKLARQAQQQLEHQVAIEGIEFREWPKISRLNRDILITEKIDGTNAAIGIIEEEIDGGPCGVDSQFRIYAQSRTRIITPQNDNMGFAAWVERNRGTLIRALGPGLHFGEWWGVGIQRGYGLSERRFSLFDVLRWKDEPALPLARSLGCALYTVPLLYQGPWVTQELADDQGYDVVFWPEVILDMLASRPAHCPNYTKPICPGSHAAPGFMSPEGIVVHHLASRTSFKATCEHDEEHKGQVR